MKKFFIILGCIVLVAAAGFAYYWFFMKNLRGNIVVPYITHQPPRIDPHVPASVPIADKLDEAMFDGLFNVSANPSGIVYEDGLGEFIGIDNRNNVTIRLKPSVKWHRSYAVTMEKATISIAEKTPATFIADDLRFTMDRIQKIGSMSPDYILIGQAIEDFSFEGPDENDEITLSFRGDRIWNEPDIKEVLSFKILPAGSKLRQKNYVDGTGPYMLAGIHEEAIYFHSNPVGMASIPKFILKPYIDNSTFTTELKNRNINTVLNIPFGSISPILGDDEHYFFKSSIATCFFALLHNVQRLDREQRTALRALVDNKQVMDRFFRIGTEQQRHIADYKGNHDNYEDYLNYSVFPSTSYYVDEQVVMPLMDKDAVDVSVLPDTVRIQTCLNFGYREELADLVSILNDPSLFGGKLKVTAVQNEELRVGNYDAVLVPISGYRSNFLFDLYDIFLRAPDFAIKLINLQTKTDRNGKRTADPASFQASKNFCRLDLLRSNTEGEDGARLLEYLYGFMSTHEIGDKQAYAQYIDELDQEMALGTWLFSLPSLAYFSTQFKKSSIDLYGVASQLSTIENWKESPVKGPGL